MRRLVKNIRSKSEKPLDQDLSGMNVAELRAFAAKLRQEIQTSSAILAQVDTQIALFECGRVRGRALSLQQRRHPPVLRKPQSGSSLGEDLQLFYDGDDSDLVVRQRQSSGGSDEAPFPLEIELYHFDGNFLSVVLNLSDDLVQGVSEQDVFELSFLISSETDCEIFLRLNIQHGPNETQMTGSCQAASRRQVKSFDLAEAGLSHRSVGRIWFDVIFTDPAMNRIVIGDLIARRRTRAQV